MNKSRILSNLYVIEKEICYHCGNTCELNNIAPCTEKMALEEAINYIKENMQEED